MHHSKAHILLIQARTSKDMLLMEQNIIIQSCSIHREQLFPVNVVYENLEDIDIASYDALIITSAGEFSASENYSWTNPLLALVKLAALISLPVIGFGWGSLILARALGGNVTYTREAAMGTHWIKLTEEGKKDLIFRDYPDPFRADMGLHEKISLLPEGAIVLAFNKKDIIFNKTLDVRIFRIKDKPIYGIPFSSFSSVRPPESSYDNRLIDLDSRADDMNPDAMSDRKPQELIGSQEVSSDQLNLLQRFLMIFVSDNVVDSVLKHDLATTLDFLRKSALSVSKLSQKLSLVERKAIEIASAYREEIED